MTPELAGYFQIGSGQTTRSFLPVQTEFSALQLVSRCAGKSPSSSSRYGSTLPLIRSVWRNRSCCRMYRASAYLIVYWDGLGVSVLSSEGHDRFLGSLAAIFAFD